MVVLKGVRHNNLYHLKGNTVTGQVVTSINSDDCTRLWHMRLEHTGKMSLQALTNQDLLKVAKTCRLEFCEQCVIGKKTKVKFGIVIHCTERILNYVYINVWGPTKTTSIGGNRYFLSFIDDFYKRCWVCILKHKGKVLKLFVEWKRNMEKNTGRKIKVVHSDNDGEYTSDPFLQLCRDKVKKITSL